MDFGLGGLLKKKIKRGQEGQEIRRDKDIRVRFVGARERKCGNMITIHYMKI